MYGGKSGGELAGREHVVERLATKDSCQTDGMQAVGMDGGCCCGSIMASSLPFSLCSLLSLCSHFLFRHRHVRFGREGFRIEDCGNLVFGNPGHSGVFAVMGDGGMGDGWWQEGERDVPVAVPCSREHVIWYRSSTFRYSGQLAEYLAVLGSTSARETKHGANPLPVFVPAPAFHLRAFSPLDCFHSPSSHHLTFSFLLSFLFSHTWTLRACA